MFADSSIKLTVSFNDPNLDSEDLEAQFQNLLAQMRDLEEIETVDRVLDPNTPVRNKVVGAILVGLLTAEVRPVNVKKLLSDRLGGKPIELEVEADVTQLSFSSKTDLIEAKNSQ